MTRAWTPIVIAFVLGGGVGFAVSRSCGLRLFHRHGDDAHAQQRLLNRFSSTVQLTPQQRTQVAAILETKRQKMDALRAEIRPRFEEIRTSTSAEIRKLLTPEQQQTFDVMQVKWDARKKGLRDRW